MRRFVLFILALIMMISLQPQLGFTQLKSPQVLRVLASVDLDTLDPHATWALTTYVYMLSPVFDSLVTKTADLKIAPALATEWSVSPDGKVWTFQLRKGVTFHNGEPFNAHVVKANVDRITNPKKFLAAKILYFKGVKAEVIDDYTVKVVTETPIADMLDNLASIGACIVSPKILDKLEKKEKVYPVGTGPFRFVDYKSGEGWTLESNDAYWGKKPYFDKLAFTVVPESPTRALMLETGEADLAINFSPKDYERLTKSDKITVDIVRPTVSRYYLGLNTQKKPLSDVRVRQALNYAVDKPAILKSVLAGIGRVADSPIGSGQGAYHLQSDGYPYNLEKARQLLNDAGYPNGFEVTLQYSPGRYMADSQIMQAVQAYLGQAKVKVKLIPLEWATLISNLKDPKKSAEAEIFLNSWGNPGVDSDLSPVFHSSNWPPGGNRTRYKNEDVDKWLDQAKAEMDTTKRVELYHKVQRQIMMDAPWLFLFERSNSVGWTKKLKGVYFQIPNVVNFNQSYFVE